MGHPPRKKIVELSSGPPRPVIRYGEPDIVDRILQYILAQIPEVAAHRQSVEQSIREEFATVRGYVRRRPIDEHRAAALLLQIEVARLFDGRNATAVARTLGISRATVYRLLKQPGRPPET